MKKLIILLTVLVGCLNASGLVFEYEGLLYSIPAENSGYCSVWQKPDRSYSGDIVIPEIAEYQNRLYTVNRVGPAAFSSCAGLTSIVIPETVTTIENSAFQSCKNLKTIVIPNSVQVIGSNVFYEAENLTSIKLPASLVEIGNVCFRGTKNLHAIDVEDSNPNYCSINGILYDKNVTTLLAAPGGYEGACEIPNTVTSVSDMAFMFSEGLTSLTIPESMTEIKLWAFANCKNLKNVTFANCSVSLGDYAFRSCDKIENIVFSPSTVSIGVECFAYNSNLQNVTIPKSVVEIGFSAFRRCWTITRINVDPENEHFASIDGILFNKNITTLLEIPSGFKGHYEIPGSVTEIRKYAAEECPWLSSVSIPEGVTTIGECAFSRCGLTSLFIPASAVNIELPFVLLDLSLIEIDVADDNPAYCSVDGVMFNKNMTAAVAYPIGKDGDTYVIPDGVLSLSYGTFYYSQKLKSITLPSTVEEIDDYALSWCQKIQDLYSYAVNPPQCTNFTFASSNLNNCVLHVPAGREEVYSTAEYWRDFANIVGDLTEGTRIALNEATASIEVGSELQLTATVTPEQDTEGMLWTSSDESIATVSDAGLVTAHAIGSATIKVRFKGVEAACHLTVNDDSGVANVSVDENSALVVYNIYGVRLNVTTAEELRNLPRGIYIVNGTKTFVQ